MAMTTTACHEVESYDNTATDNFESLWQLFDRHYCFFDEKGVDWNDIHDRYAPMAEQCRTQQQLFMVCSEMLDELKDGHVNLGSSFDTYYTATGGQDIRKTSTFAYYSKTTCISATSSWGLCTMPRCRRISDLCT